MRLSLRFILPLALVLGLIAYGIVPLVDTLTFKWFNRDLEMRSKLITSAVQDSVVEALQNPTQKNLDKLFNRIIQDERLFALAYCDIQNRLIYKTQTLPTGINCEPIDQTQTPHSRTSEDIRGILHLTFYPIITEENQLLGQLILVHDIGYIQRRSADTKKYLVYLFLGLATIISLVTVIIAQLSWLGLVKGLRAILSGEGLIKPSSRSAAPELRPFIKDLRTLVRDLETERRVKDESQISWNPKALKEILHNELSGDEILIVSNREPYIHVRTNENIEVRSPASGLVTALEPVMRACSGTWIAHGSGSADREVVDKDDHVQVPPDEPSYQIRRVWLTKEEEDGYYYGFANEGLWPLCHIAHVRPIFRSKDWQQYIAVNQKFADTVAEEAKTDNPVVLVQDFHFALLPKMIRKKLPKATVITFWHIPFPNPEVFSVCPWREELLEGLLGSSIIGFHTRFHCNNFIDTIDRFIESRIDRETSTVCHQGNLTVVNHYPISIEYPVKWLKTQKSIRDCYKNIRAINSLPNDRLIGVGVDRLDYTKGILERFLAVERLFELEPQWIGKFNFIQIAAPSRSSIDQYQHFEADVRALCTKINRKYGSETYQPIILKVEHHEPEQVYEYFRGANLCFVSSLHDGMNLVAKEFIASRDDEQGVLILSQFTGAARELAEALIVNPYNIDQCAAALKIALEMKPEEQRNRIRSMRGLIQEFNVFRWAGKMLMDAARLRQRTRLFGESESNTKGFF
jgi:trehalose 6-phosphate synthase